MAPDEAVAERAARFFETWAAKHLRALGAVGGYNSQESIAYVGRMYFSRYANGSQGWYEVRVSNETIDPVALTVTTSYGYVSRPEEIKFGYATSFVYYPCAD